MIGERQIPVSDIPFRESPMVCVKPVDKELSMCGQAATHAAVRASDGWVTGTVWCQTHVNEDVARDKSYDIFPDAFTWNPIVL